MSRPNPHTALIADTLALLRLSARDRGIFFKNSTGMFYKNQIPHYYGVKGSPDIYGITTAGYFGLEGKTGSGSQSPDQREFERVTRHYFQFYFVFHTPAEALQFVLTNIPIRVPPTQIIRQKSGGIF